MQMQQFVFSWFEARYELEMLAVILELRHKVREIYACYWDGSKCSHTCMIILLYKCH